MKYSDTSKFPKAVGSAGFYAIVACCLIAIGAAAWFAVSRQNLKSVPEGNDSQNESYSSQKESYNNSDDTPSIDETVPNTSIESPQSNIPYSSEETTTVKKSFSMPIEGEIIKDHSTTQLQYSSTYGDLRLHNGIDIKCEKNAQINSAGIGTVKEIVDDPMRGKTVVIDHGDGIIAKYCGLDVANVKVGQSVTSQTIIGIIGSVPFECADDIHLHLEVLKDGNIASPTDTLKIK